ncbi:FxsB family cyclophane-forming radical SAM/SPASM peptide maturase [Allonocardiopsis opalescens]|uniref:Radical SAM core domain-containing protein n=1 Tax=Allonocardiopsis opalescens TaxID=1144618 RepID=A0A2T0Q9Q2_9ACTN|nr:FxsB family cyclophane-forming radical SAM/SPASM peptide maturase [Allonocardiopsis opalescens]PRY00540.1 uncharacterized protein CLV72_102171 [Allonocardiopsis opalescens]
MTAPWPGTGLDVAALRAAGLPRLPFREFVLKVHSRCDLACSYCYVYEMADQSWREQPRRMPDDVADAAVARVAEHARAHALDAVRLVLHGGEPLLAGADFLTGLVARFRAAVPARLDVRMQTNGVSLTEPVLSKLAAAGVRIGVSLDGDREATDRYRRRPGGRSSHPAVVRALRLLGAERYRPYFGGILCTVDLANDPVSTYRALLEFDPPAVDFLLPHGTWTAPPPGRRPGEPATPYADWLIAVFEDWYGAPAQTTRVRLFTEILHLLLGGASASEAVGLSPARTLVIETNGEIKQLDTLSAAYSGAARTGLHVAADPLDAALDHPTTVARQLGAAALSEDCLACPVHRVCGGGYYPHRYRAGSGFKNPSVYCPDLYALIAHISGRLRADLAARSR